MLSHNNSFEGRAFTRYHYPDRPKSFPRDIDLGYEYEVSDDFTNSGEYSYNKLIRVIRPELPKFFETCADGGGVEFKSPIAPLRIHKSTFTTKLLESNIPWNKHTKGRRTIEDERRKSPVNYGGIHVHIGRDAYTNEVRNKLFKYFHETANDDFLRALSGRCDHSFTSNCCRHNGDRFRRDIEHQHYGIINERQKTFEIRMFKALPHLIVVALEAADSIVRAAHECEGSLSTEAWRKYLNCKPKYRELRQRMDRVLIKGERNLDDASSSS